MRFPFRAIGAGLLAGTAFFFFPFLLRFLFTALLIGFIVRLVLGRGFRGRGWGHRYYHHSAYANYDNDIVPIDGQHYASRISGNGAPQSFRVM